MRKPHLFVALFLVTVLARTTWADDPFAVFRNVAADKDANVSVSPYGAQVALGLIAPGAEGETKAEFQSVLGYADPGEIAAKLNVARYSADGSPLNVATSLWLRQGFAAKPDFIESAEKNLAAQVAYVRFGDSSAADAINAWCNEKTKGKINGIIDQTDGDMRLVAVSALYFLADWMEPFNERGTKDETFHVSATREKQVPMMRAERNYGYAETESAQWLRLPYKNKGFFATVILPKEGVAIDDVVKGLTADTFAQQRFRSTKVNVKLPRFETEFETSLDGALKSMGLQSMFSRRAANFSGITESERLFVDSVLQKVYMKVDEKGTEAAAVTAIVAVSLSLEMLRPAVDFHAIRPFVFVVSEGENILFASKILEP